jgi:hypothetical protein
VCGGSSGPRAARADGLPLGGYAGRVSLADLIVDARRVAVVGLAKNTGKTETLGADERPRPLWVAVVVASLLSIGILVSVATVHDLRSRGGSVPGGVFLACVLGGLAWGMYRRRYWAVLSFEGLLAFQIIVTSLALVVASTILAGALCTISIGLGGWLFWKLVRVMGRIQAGEREYAVADAYAAADTDRATDPAGTAGATERGEPLR